MAMVSLDRSCHRRGEAWLFFLARTVTGFICFFALKIPLQAIDELDAAVGPTDRLVLPHQVEVGSSFKRPGRAIPVQSPCLRVNFLSLKKRVFFGPERLVFFGQFRMNFCGCLKKLETLRPCAVCGGPTVLCCSGCEATHATRSILNWLDLERVYLDIQTVYFLSQDIFYCSVNCQQKAGPSPLWRVWTDGGFHEWGYPRNHPVS